MFKRDELVVILLLIPALCWILWLVGDLILADLERPYFAQPPNHPPEWAEQPIPRSAWEHRYEAP